jgi:hypothetical protein
MVRVLVYPIGGGVPVTLDFEAADSLSDALVLDLRPTDAENVLKGGATEYSFDVPQTPINRAVFDDWQNYQRDAGTAVLYRDGVLEVNGFPARLGKIALMSATDEVARLTMFFDSEDSFRALQDLRVNELDWDVVQDTSTAGLVSIAYFSGITNVCTIPAKLRSWPVDGNGDRVVTNADFYPCISVKSIFYQALQRTTPTAPATLDFIAQWCGSDVFENLVIFLNKNRDYDKAYLERKLGAYIGSNPFTAQFYEAPLAAQTYAPMDFLVLETAPYYDNGSNYTGSPGVSRYIAPLPGEYRFDFTFTCGPNMPTGGIAPFTDGSIYIRALVNAVPSPSNIAQIGLLNGVVTTRSGRITLILAAGDIVDFECIFWVLAVAPIGFQNGDIQSFTLLVSMAPDSYSAGTLPMITGAWIPRDWSVADVFRDVFRMFNLRMFWDSVRQTMAIAPARRWYNQLNGQTYSGFMTRPEADWTDLVVEPPSEVIAERWAWDYWLLHREPADAWLKAQSALSEVRSAGGRVNTGRDGAQRNEVELENSAAMAHIFDGTISDPSKPPAMIPMLLSKDHTLDPIGQTNFNEDDSCFYLMASPIATPTIFGAIRLYDIPTGITGYAGCVRASQVPYDDVTNTSVRPSLAFGNEASINGAQITGLISNYHFGTIASANNGKLMKAYIRLSSVALQTYTFDRPVRIGPRIFEVLRINGKPAESDIYEVTLQTIDYPDAAALTWLQNPNTATYLTYDADPE